MSPIRLIILLGAAIAAVAAAFLVRNMAQAGPSAAPAQTQTVVETREVSQTKVLVTRRDLEIGDLLSVEDMVWSDWPEKSVADGYRTEEDYPESIEEFAGSIVRVPMYRSEPVVPHKLVQKGDTSMMAALLPQGMRAMSVEISTESASGGFILPNDYVDVLVTYEVEYESNGKKVSQPTSSTIVRNVRVLAIDQMHVQDEEGRPVQIGDTATLELMPDEAELVALAQSIGEVSLALRSWSDAGESESREAFLEMLSGGGASNGGVVVYRNGKASSGMGGN